MDYLTNKDDLLIWLNRMIDYIEEEEVKNGRRIFFGTIKNEFFYPKNWKYTTSDDFINELEKYLNWFKNKRMLKLKFKVRL